MLLKSNKIRKKIKFWLARRKIKCILNLEQVVIKNKFKAARPSCTLRPMTKPGGYKMMKRRPKQKPNLVRLYIIFSKVRAYIQR